MKKRWIKKIVFFLMASLSLFLVTVTHAAAQQLPFYWDRINVTIDVQANGDMLVTEKQKYVFTADYNTEHYRYIPLEKVDEITDVTVEENNQTIASSTGIENNQLWIRWQHQLKAPESHTFVLKYRVVGGLHLDGQNTQVYWKAIAAGRKAPINAANVRVQLPESLSGKVVSFTNFGTVAVPCQVDPKTFEFVASEPIPPEQELEVQIAFPQPILNLPEPGWQQTSNQPESSLGEEGFSIDFGLFITFFMLFSLALMPILYIKEAINNRRCPNCKTLNLKRTYQVLIDATTSRSGRQRVTCNCGNCSYHNEYKAVIPIISPDSGGGSGGSVGGGGGDSSDGGGGGGGDGGGSGEGGGSGDGGGGGGGG